MTVGLFPIGSTPPGSRVASAPWTSRWWLTWLSPSAVITASWKRMKASPTGLWCAYVCTGSVKPSWLQCMIAAGDNDQGCSITSTCTAGFRNYEKNINIKEILLHLGILNQMFSHWFWINVPGSNFSIWHSAILSELDLQIKHSFNVEN